MYVIAFLVISATSVTMQHFSVSWSFNFVGIYHYSKVSEYVHYKRNL